MLRALFRTMLMALPVAVLSLMGCGSSGSSDSHGDPDASTQAGVFSGVTGTKTIGSLTDADKKQICDWTASLYGGYGQTITCSAISSITGPESQAACLAVAATIESTCSATVTQAESCTKIMATCNGKVGTESCAALFACYPSASSP